MFFLEADRFAHLYDSVRAHEDRTQAIVIEHFLGTESIVINEAVLGIGSYKSFGVYYAKTKSALEQLVQLEIISPEGDLYGLTRLMEAERSIAKFLLSNHAIELSEDVKRIIQ